MESSSTISLASEEPRAASSSKSFCGCDASRVGVPRLGSVGYDSSACIIDDAYEPSLVHGQDCEHFGNTSCLILKIGGKSMLEFLV